MFYTRIPVPRWMNHNDELLNRATIYFPIIGWIIGAISAAIFWMSSLTFSPEIAILLSMVASIWATGAFHEDGFADVCDGFGGGWTKLKILEIMKDSRLGTYGAVGLGSLLGLKFLCLKELNQTNSLGATSEFNLILALLIAHPLSRFVALTFIYTHEYVRENEDSKAKPVAKKITTNEVFIAAVGGLLPLLLVSYWYSEWGLLAIVLPLIVVKWYLGRFFSKWIGGYTGDCLGATQQLAEITIYLFLLIGL